MVDGKFKKYDKVRVVEPVHYYSSANWFKKGLSVLISAYGDNENLKYTVRNSMVHPGDPCRIIYLIVNRKGEFIEIDEQGLELRA